MLGMKKHYEAVIEAQSRHIDRLNDMVSQLFNALMMVRDKPAGIMLTGKEQIETVKTEQEPEPGEFYDPLNIKGMP